MSELKYISTRGNRDPKRGAQAIIQGLAEDRGLYVPERMPREQFDLDGMIGVSFRSVAYRVLKDFFPDFTEDELRRCVEGAYDDKFDHGRIAPVIKTKKAFFLELYHGRTAAFKDMALSILPYLLTTAVRKENEDRKIVILTATSGDTGKAALEGFADVSGTEIIVFYPASGVSEIQERQMTTQRGSNTHVFAIDGNFDAAQNGVKKIFSDENYGSALAKRGFKLSSANSINIGRLAPQVAYYVYAYLQLVETSRIDTGDPINVVVPTGNFGNILAAWYAKEMGLPIGRLICASNENRVLTDFINSGVYDGNRQFLLTSSPSMDILISSNLERLLYHLSGGDSAEIAGYMKSLEKKGKYQVSDEIRKNMKPFYGGFADMESAHKTIAQLWEDEHYLIDTHTAVGYQVYLNYLNESGDTTPTVVASTASAYKFADRLTKVLGMPAQEDGFDAIEALHSKTEKPIPSGLRGLRNRPVLHKGHIKEEDMKTTIDAALGS